MTTRFADEPQPTGEIPIEAIRRARATGHGNVHGGGPGPGIDWRRLIRWFWLVVGVVALGAVWILLVMRWRETSHPLAIAIVGVMPLLATGPLLIAGLGAWWSKSASLRVLASLTTAGFLFTTSPLNAVIGCGADDAAFSGADNVFTIYTANVWFESPGGQPDQIAGAIAAEDPDVVLLQEVELDFLNALRADDRLSAYTNRSTDRQGLPIQNLVWSKWPIETATFLEVDNARLTDTTVTTPTGPVTLSSIHLQAPVSRAEAELWKRQHATLARVDRSEPRIMAGDFNATRDHQPFRNLLDSGWTDAHEVKGCGYDATWPVGRRLPAPVMRLDHVLVTDHFDVLDVRLGDPGGSDHLPVITTLRLNG